MLTEKQLNQYFKDGFVIVENLFTRDKLHPAMYDISGIVGEFAEELYKAGNITSKYENEGFYSRLTSRSQRFPGIRTPHTLQRGPSTRSSRLPGSRSSMQTRKTGH